MIWKILAIILTIFIIASTTVSAYLYLNPRTVLEINNIYKNVYRSDMKEVDLEYNTIETIQKEPKNIDQIYVTGWIPEWDVADGLEAIEQRPDTFNSISPIWFFINPDGTLKKTSQTNGANQIDFFKDQNIDLIPSVQEFDAANFSKVLNNSENLNKLINQITAEAIKNNYRGIDLDIESIYLQDKHLFFDFLEKLSNKLKGSGKLLSFTVLPKWGNLLFFRGFPQTLRVQDYKRIGDLVDEFRIMTYEYSGSGSQQIGPVQPLTWQEQVLQYTILTGIPRDKIILGVATYSYDWTERPFLDEIDLKKPTGLGQINLNFSNGVALSNSSIDKIKDNYEYTEEFNEEWGEMVLRYEFQDKKRIVVYPNDRSIELRKQLAADYGIKGIAYWRVGDETELKL